MDRPHARGDHGCAVTSATLLRSFRRASTLYARPLTRFSSLSGAAASAARSWSVARLPSGTYTASSACSSSLPSAARNWPSISCSQSELDSRQSGVSDLNVFL